MAKRVTNKERTIQTGMEVSIAELEDMVSTLNVILKNRKKVGTSTPAFTAEGTVAPKPVVRRRSKNNPEGLQTPAAVAAPPIAAAVAVNGAPAAEPASPAESIDF